MLLGYLLLILLPVAAIAYIVWNHKKKVAERNAAAAGRLHELLAATQLQTAAQSPAQPTAPAETSLPPARPCPEPQPLATPAAPLYSARSRMLTPPQNLLFLLLRTGLPEHVIFARPTLASIIEAGPALAARGDEARTLSAMSVDFVVADRNLRPLAVVQLRDGDATPEDERAAARTRIAAAGLRYLELDAAALPRKDAIRTLVLGENTQLSAATNSA